MIVGILQFELLIHDAESLKDKRRVVRSVKDRLHREHQVSVAEVGRQDRPELATMGLALVGSDGRRVGQVLDSILEKLRSLRDAELGNTRRDLLHGVERPEAEERTDVRGLSAEVKAELEREMLASLDEPEERSL